MQKKLKKKKIKQNMSERERERDSFDGKTMHRMKKSEKIIVRVWK